MNRQRIFGPVAAAMLVLAGGGPAFADFEVTGPDGRRILLTDDGKWRYLEPEAKPAAGAQAKPKTAKPKTTAKPEAEAETTAAAADKDAQDADKKDADKEKKDAGEALLSLERKVDGDRICRFSLRMVNNLPFEIRSLVPEFRAYRANGVVYDAVFGAFQFIRPGDSQSREVRFNGIGCPDIARLQVAGGDRCEMGDLDKFSRDRGKCLAHIRLVESDLVRFDK